MRLKYEPASEPLHISVNEPRNPDPGSRIPEPFPGPHDPPSEQAPASQSRNSKPETRNPTPETRNPKPETPKKRQKWKTPKPPKPDTRNLKQMQLKSMKKGLVSLADSTSKVHQPSLLLSSLEFSDTKSL